MRGRRTAAFTLAETLVVVAIAAVLAALAFFGGRAAIAAAKTRSCATNLRQIGTGLALYSHDYDDRYPPYTFQGVGKLPPRTKEFKAALRTYGVTDEQFYCPLDPYARTDHRSEFYTHTDTSYDMSIDYYNHGKAVGDGFVFSPSLVPDPGSVYVFYDSSDFLTDEAGKRHRAGPHGERNNVLWADGSVTNVPIVQP